MSIGEGWVITRYHESPGGLLSRATLYPYRADFSRSAPTSAIRPADPITGLTWNVRHVRTMHDPESAPTTPYSSGGFGPFNRPSFGVQMGGTAERRKVLKGSNPNLIGGNTNETVHSCRSVVGVQHRPSICGPA